MELRELAERILFGTTLDDKLVAADEISDESPGPAIVAPSTPGRPPELVFKAGRNSGEGAPPKRVLEGDRDRGRLLHFFANHELLATELMALVLLRFPDAPAAFRRSVLQTLRDEQEHTRLYVERMRECGVTFGEFPVSGYFWRSVAPMTTPLDYVSGLSLTFEQANLDFCRHFARGFEDVGDHASARILEGIHRDEIAHVALGLKWFRRWKDPALRDWDAFCRALRFPLSPQRAKGIGWDAESRRAAGFDAEFVDRLRVFAASRGRTPNVFWFNPFAEGILARGPGFTPVRDQVELARDLAALPQFLGQRDDVVIVPRRPGQACLARLQDAGFPLLEFVETGDGPRPECARKLSHAFQGRKLGQLRPWAWSPDAMEVLGPLQSQSTGGGPPAQQVFPADWARLYSKGWSAAWLRATLQSGVDLESAHAGAPDDWLCREHEIGVEVCSAAEALKVVGAIRARGHHRVVIKESLGLAGGNAARWWEPEPSPSQRAALERAVEGGRTVVVEPWLERVLEVSVQWEMTRGELRLIGFAGLQTDGSGRYLGNTFSPGWERRLPLFGGRIEDEDGCRRVGRLAPRWYLAIRPRLEAALRAVGFEGPLGMDAFAYWDEAGVVRWKPVVEINPRYTMGRVALALAARVAPGVHGLLRIVRFSAVRRLGHARFGDWARDMMAQFPVLMTGVPRPRLASGVVILTDPDAASNSLAVLRVDREHRTDLTG